MPGMDLSIVYVVLMLIFSVNERAAGILDIPFLSLNGNFFTPESFPFLPSL